MIVPTRRLLVSYGLVVPFLMLLPLWGGSHIAAVLGGCLLFAAVAALDCVLAFARSRDLSVFLPALARMTKGRESFIEVGVRNSGRGGATIRLGLPLPVQVSSLHDSLPVIVAGGGSSVCVTWPCTPLRRGRFVVRGCHVETRSPIGLWADRKRHEGVCEIRVYPDLLSEGRQLSALFLNRDSFGLHARRQQGKGREFERLREYAPGDGYDEISWKATAKRNHPVTRLFQIERTQEVYVCIDASRLSGRLWEKNGRDGSDGDEALSGAGGETQLDRFIGASLLFGLAARKQGDLFGMISFDESVRGFMRAAGSRSHYAACRENLVNLSTRLVNPDYGELFTFLRLKLRRRSLIVVLTSLDDPLLAETFARTVELVCHDHLVYVVMAKPEGARPVFSNENVRSIDEVYDELSGHEVWHGLRELGGTLRSRGVNLALVERERLCLDLISRYMDVKQRQLL